MIKNILNFNSDDDLLLNKKLNLHNVIIVVRAVFHEDNEGIYVNKTDGLRECIIYYYWYFLNISFRFHPDVWLP